MDQINAAAASWQFTDAHFETTRQGGSVLFKVCTSLSDDCMKILFFFYLQGFPAFCTFCYLPLLSEAKQVAQLKLMLELRSGDFTHIRFFLILFVAAQVGSAWIEFFFGDWWGTLMWWEKTGDQDPLINNL